VGGGVLVTYSNIGVASSSSRRCRSQSPPGWSVQIQEPFMNRAVAPL
jgi:hypothetical protein